MVNLIANLLTLAIAIPLIPLIVVWFIVKKILCRCSPAFALREARRKYEKDPNEFTQWDVFEAEKRFNNSINSK